MAAEEGACPKCGGKEAQPAGILRKNVSPLLKYLGGVWLSLLWSSSRKEQVRCVGCDNIFERTTPTSKIARVLLIIFIVIMLLGLFAAIFSPSPEH